MSTWWQQLKASGVTAPLFAESARQAIYQATKGLPRKVNKLAVACLRLAAQRSETTVDNAIVLDATQLVLL